MGTNVRNLVTHLLVVSALGSAALLVGARAAGAEEPIDSTTELKQACEAAPEHHIYVTIDIKINGGPHEEVRSGCKVSLGPLASFEATHVSMGFAGPFEIYSALDRSVSFTGSVWRATSMGLYGDRNHTFRNDASHLLTTAGKIEIITGPESQVQLQTRPAASVNNLEAAGVLSITGSDKLAVSLNQAGIQGGTGVRIHFGGRDSALKAEYADVRSPRGFISMSAVIPKAVVELKGVTVVSGRGDATIRLAGSESQLKAELTRISSRGGSVDLRAGGQGGYSGVVELVETNVDATRGVRLQASLEDRWGTVKVGKSGFSGGMDVVFVTGAFGATAVTESSISSGTAIRVLTGTGGSCTSEKNTYRAPRLEICP